jgi:hypothetical protein
MVLGMSIEVSEENTVTVWSVTIDLQNKLHQSVHGEIVIVSAYRFHVWCCQSFQSFLCVRPMWHGFKPTGHRGVGVEMRREKSVTNGSFISHHFPHLRPHVHNFITTFLCIGSSFIRFVQTAPTCAVCSVLASSGYNLWFQVRIQSATGSWSVRTYRVRSAHTELNVFYLVREWKDIHWKDIRKTNQIITTNR